MEIHNSVDIIDDLDEELDLTNIPQVPQSQIDDAEKIDLELKSNCIKSNTPIPANPLMSKQARKAMLKKKIAAKKSSRSKGNDPRLVQSSVASILNSGMMDNMMNSLVKNNGGTEEDIKLAKKEIMEKMGSKEMTDMMKNSGIDAKSLRGIDPSQLSNIDPSMFQNIFQMMGKK